MRGFTAVLVVSLFCPISNVSAQHTPPVTVGDRVRVRQCRSELFSSGWKIVCERSVGTLSTLSTNAVTVRLEDSATELAVALDSVARLDMSRGRHRSAVRSVGFGALGFLGGGLGGCLIAGGGGEGYNEGIACLIGGGIGGGVGLVVGAIVGASSRERWEEVPLDRLRVSFAPQRDGFAVGFTIAF
ncbi:hypothetical protein ACFL3B_00505 [Gemmatimonadota bacterium]